MLKLTIFHSPGCFYYCNFISNNTDQSPSDVGPTSATGKDFFKKKFIYSSFKFYRFSEKKNPIYI